MVVLVAAILMARNDPTTTNFREHCSEIEVERGEVTTTHQNLVSNARFAHFLIERVAML